MAENIWEPKRVADVEAHFGCTSTTQTPTTLAFALFWKWSAGPCRFL